MFCTNCGEENEDNAKFCKKCGHPLTEAEKTETNDQFTEAEKTETNGQFKMEGNDQNQWSQSGAHNFNNNYKPVQLFALIMCVIMGWFFIKNGIPSIVYIVSEFFGDIFRGFNFFGFGRLFGVNILRLLQAASYALMTFVMFTVFTRWKDEKAPEFMLTSIVSAVIIAVIGLIRFILFTVPFLAYGYAYSWLVWTIMTAAVSAVGLIAFVAFMGLPVKPVRDGESLTDSITNSFKFVYSEFMDELKKIQANNESRQKGQNAGKAQEGQDAGEGQMGQNVYRPVLRTNYSFVAYLFLGWITCGIYDLYLIHCFSKDINVTGQGDGENTMGVLPLILLSLATCGIFSYIYYYKLGNRVQRTGARYGLQIQESGTTMLLWLIFGALICFIGPYIAMYMLIKNINMVNDAYNRSVSMR